MKTTSEIAEIKKVILESTRLNVVAEENNVLTLNQSPDASCDICASLFVNLETGECEDPRGQHLYNITRIYNATKQFYPPRERKSLIDHVKEIVPAERYDTREMKDIEDVEIIHVSQRRGKTQIAFTGVQKMTGFAFPCEELIIVAVEGDEAFVWDFKKL